MKNLDQRVAEWVEREGKFVERGGVQLWFDLINDLIEERHKLIESLVLAIHYLQLNPNQTIAHLVTVDGVLKSIEAILGRKSLKEGNKKTQTQEIRHEK